MSATLKVPTLGVVACGVVAWTRKKGANRDQHSHDQHSRDQRARSGGLRSGGLDLKRGANRDQRDVDSSKGGVLLRSHIAQAQAATVYMYFESCPVSMALFGQSQSVDSAYREKPSCSGPRSVLSTDQNKDLLWNKVSLEPPTVSFSGESRYLTPLWVSRKEEPLNELYEIIRAVLKQLVLRAQHVLVQFWSPRVVGKRQILTTLDQPFGFGLPVEELYFYRKESEQNLFLVCKDDEEQDISPPARVFRRGLPEWTPDVTNYLPKHFPQQDCAIRCNLHGYLALPIFDSTTPLCIGVLELLMSSKNTDYTFEVQQVHKALKLQNLTCPQTFDCATPQVLSECRQNVWDKIRCILKSVCDIHKLPLAQTWAVSPHNSFVSHEKTLQKSCSSFDTKCIGKVCMSTTSLPFYVRDMGMWPFREACKMQHLDKSRSFVGRAMLAHGSSYCEDITQLCEDEYPLVYNARMSGLTGCFTIFLHSIEGDNGDYVLEFFLPLNSKDSRHVLNLVQTLKQMIVVASGFELGEISPIQITESPRDETCLSLSVEPQSIHISSTTTTKTLAFGMDSTDSESVLANVVKTDSADGQSQCSSKENYTNDMSDNVNIVNSRENDNAASYSIVTNQNPSDTITDAGEKSKKRGRKRKIDSLTMEAVVQHVGKPISQAAESFGVCRSTLKRFCRENGILSWSKLCQSKKTSCDTESKSESIYQVAQLMVKATFKGDMIKFRFPISSGLLELENEVAQRLDLKGKTLIIKYKDEENDWLRITCDDDLQSLPEFLASNTTIRLIVELASN
ncbi:NIN-like protein [Artemisia annua]|uniref:NIN-like protein n=1 Tax=Artemisia annua TaxID=35608 RepID=A0A2U1N5Z1_ARTAN|nr:NIN-like protein [Artemisia annua]